MKNLAVVRWLDDSEKSKIWQEVMTHVLKQFAQHVEKDKGNLPELLTEPVTFSLPSVSLESANKKASEAEKELVGPTPEPAIVGIDPLPEPTGHVVASVLGDNFSEDDILRLALQVKLIDTEGRYCTLPRLLSQW